MKPGGVVAAILCLVGAVFLFGWDKERQGLERGRTEALAANNERLTRVVRQRDTVYVRTRDTLTRQLKLWDSVRVTDTIVVATPGRPESVTVYVPRNQADTAVQMCLRTLSSCDASLHARDSLIYGLRAQLKLLEAVKPKRCGIVKGFGVSGGVDMARKPNVTLGVILGVGC